MALQLDPKILADLLLDPKFGAEALMGWKLDDYQSAALKLWSQDLVGNVASAQKTVFARARDNGLAALGQWKKAS